MSVASLNGATCLSATVHIPAWGIPFAEVVLDVERELSGAVELQIQDLTVKAAVVSGGPWQGRSSYRLVAGSGGWSRTLGAKGYADDAGVRIATVLEDAATEAGESITDVPAGTVGFAWERRRGPASLALQLLYPRGWYVGTDGVTRVGKRSGRVMTANHTRGRVDLAAGYVELMADELGELVPGVIVDGVEAVDVVHEVADSKLRTTIWGTAFASTSKRLQAWAKLLEQLDPAARYRGIYEYRVVTQEGDRLNLQPIRASLGLSDLRRVRMRPGLAGCRATVALGSAVLVAFVNADPARPVVVGFEDAEQPGFRPSRLDLVGADDLGVDPAGAIGRVVRYGDPITFASPGPGTVVLPAAGSLSRVRA